MKWRNTMTVTCSMKKKKWVTLNQTGKMMTQATKILIK